MLEQLMRGALRPRDHVRAGCPHAGQRPVDVCTVLSQAAQVLLHSIQRLWQAEVVILARGTECCSQKLGMHVILGLAEEADSLDICTICHGNSNYTRARHRHKTMSVSWMGACLNDVFSSCKELLIDAEAVLLYGGPEASLCLGRVLSIEGG